MRRPLQLQCSRCQKEYTLDEILSGAYWLETFTCMECYAHLQGRPHEVSCFGKPTVVSLTSDKKKLGYDPDAMECKSVCPDRNICRYVVSGSRPKNT